MTAAFIAGGIITAGLGGWAVSRYFYQRDLDRLTTLPESWRRKYQTPRYPITERRREW